MSLLPYHKGNKTNFINLLFTLTRFVVCFRIVFSRCVIFVVVYRVTYWRAASGSVLLLSGVVFDPLDR